MKNNVIAKSEELGSNKPFLQSLNLYNKPLTNLNEKGFKNDSRNSEN